MAQISGERRLFKAVLLRAIYDASGGASPRDAHYARDYLLSPVNQQTLAALAGVDVMMLSKFIDRLSGFNWRLDQIVADNGGLPDGTSILPMLKMSASFAARAAKEEARLAGAADRYVEAGKRRGETVRQKNIARRLAKNSEIAQRRMA